jgi:hypothetical protein
MRSTLVVALSLLVLVLPAQAARHAKSSTMTIRLISTTTTYKVLVDRAPKQEINKGDVLWAKSILRNAIAQFGKPKGAIVGSDISTYTVVSITPGVGDEKVTATLPGGTIRAAGRVRETRAQTIRVTGGTGTFANASGSGEVRSLNASGDRTLNVYRLQLP